jgi:hypothetical protein
MRRSQAVAATALDRLMKETGAKPATLHGFRSALRDWAGDETDYSREICEAALAHVVSGVEGAYRRGTAFAKRRQLMPKRTR